MGEVKKINDQYYIEFHARGLLYQQKAGNDYQRACQMLQEVEEKIAHGQMNVITRDVDWDIFYEDFLSDARNKYNHRNLGYFNEVISSFNNFLLMSSFSLPKLSSINPSIFEKYKLFLSRTRNFNSDYFNFYFVLLYEIFEFARKLGYLHDHPMRHFKWFQEFKTDLKFLDSDQLQKFLLNYEESQRDVVEFMFLTSLNLDEVKALRWGQIDMNNKKLVFNYFDKASSPKRETPFFNRTQEVLKKQEKISTGPFSEVNDKIIRNIDEDLIKNTFAFMAISKGIRLPQLSLMMSCDDLFSMMKYFRFLNHKT